MKKLSAEDSCGYDEWEQEDGLPDWIVSDKGSNYWRRGIRCIRCGETVQKYNYITGSKFEKEFVQRHKKCKAKQLIKRKVEEIVYG